MKDGRKVNDDHKDRWNQFAELLAEGLTVREACHFMDITFGQGEGILRRIRKSLGPQAV